MLLNMLFALRGLNDPLSRVRVRILKLYISLDLMFGCFPLESSTGGREPSEHLPVPHLMTA